jgi:hypothetical protein
MKDDYKVTGVRWRRASGWLCDVCRHGMVLRVASWCRDVFVKKYGKRPYHGDYYCEWHAKLAKDDRQSEGGER